MAHMAAPHMFKSACSTYSMQFLLEMFDVAVRFSIEVSGLGGTSSSLEAGRRRRCRKLLLFLPHSIKFSMLMII